MQMGLKMTVLHQKTLRMKNLKQLERTVMTKQLIHSHQRLIHNRQHLLQLKVQAQPMRKLQNRFLSVIKLVAFLVES